MHLTALDVINSTERYFSMPVNKQKQWLLDTINEHSHEILLREKSISFQIAGLKVCQASFCRVYSISEKRIRRVSQSVSAGQKIVEHGNKGKQKSNTKSDMAVAWMDRYFHLIGDNMPYKKQVHLLSWETQKDIYHIYCEDMKRQGVVETDILSFSLFYKVWKADFPSVVIPEVSESS